MKENRIYEQVDISNIMDNRYNKLLISSSFNSTLEELKQLQIKLPKESSQIDHELDHLYFPPDGNLVTSMDRIEKVKLDPGSGVKWAENRTIAAYDESIRRFNAIEGTAYFTAHSLVVGRDYVPLTLVTFYFYTKARTIASDSIKYSDNPGEDSKKDYARDRMEFLKDYAPGGCLLFIDGPIIGGDVYTMMIGHLKDLRARGIVPVFFVKDSTSNLVTDNIPELRGRYNSDFHWCYNFLKPGERTNFFRYVDRHNPKNAKIFCYLRTFGGLQRVELDVRSFDELEDLMNYIYYLILAQGDTKNPQVRPIAIAERYAREVLNVIEIENYMKGLVPTMNQKRFG